MSDEDDKRGRKDNTGRAPKPEHAQDKENALRGSVGTDRIFGGPSLGMGGSRTVRQVTQAREQSETQEPPGKEDRLPLAVRTGVEEIDKQTKAEGYQLANEDEIKDMAHGPDPAGPETTAPERTGDRFIETNDPEVNDFYQKTDEPVSREDAERMKAEEIAKKFQKDREQDRDRGR